VIVTVHASKHKTRQNKNITYKNYDSKSIKKGKDTRAHRSLRLLPELERRLNLDRVLPALLLLNRNLYKWRTTRRVVCVSSTVRILI
jgi:hypothetical protein